MRVYYISSGLQGCYLYRCLNPLSANGWDGDQTSIRLDTKETRNKSIAAQASQIVVFHRPEDKNKLELARILKKQGKKVVYDNDDTAKHDGGFLFNRVLDEERVKRGLKTINENLDTFISEADLVTCSTQYLADEYKKLNKNVVVLPNLIDPFYFDEPLKNTNGKIRIGIVGSIAITDDIKVVKPIVEKYHNDQRVEIVLFSLPPARDDVKTRELYEEEYKFWDNVNITWQPFVPMEEYYDTLNELHLDMMIIPRADNYFNRCKSNVKFLEASMFEIPCICQSFPDKKSPYEVNEEDTKHLLLATDTESWIQNIEKLIENKELREKMGKDAKEYVLENYNLETKGYLWKEVYASLLE